MLKYITGFLVTAFLLWAPSTTYAMETAPALNANTQIVSKRIKLHCDPFIPVGTVRLNKNGDAKRDKDGNVIFDRPTPEEIKKQRAECMQQQFFGKMYNKNKTASSEPETNTGTETPAPDPTQVVLVGPPDNTAYFDPTHDMWFGMLWTPVPSADIHMLCITPNSSSSCPDDPRNAQGLNNLLGYYADSVPSTDTHAVREMPEFCYTTNRCLWSVAACNLNSNGLSWNCEYATPFRRVRVTDQQ